MEPKWTVEKMIKKFNLDILESTSIDGIHWEYRPNREDILKKINEIIDVVNSIDEQKDEPIKHGRWINPTAADCYRCSVCEEYTRMEIPGLLYHYCPNCGARMENGNNV